MFCVSRFRFCRLSHVFYHLLYPHHLACFWYIFCLLYVYVCCLCLSISLPGVLYFVTRLVSYFISIAFIVRKHQRSESLLVATSTKKKSITALLQILLSQGKSANNAVFCTVIGSSYSVFSNSRLVLVKYPPLDHIWVTFANLYSYKYLKSASNPEDYNQYV